MMDFPYINGSALVLAVMLAWAIYKTMKGE
jgi:hypothetical protein